MKYLILQLAFVLPLSLNGQSNFFEYIFSKTQSDIFYHAIETSDSNFLITTSQILVAYPSHSSVIKLNKKGEFIKKLTFENDSLKTYINRLVQTNYGFLGVGGQIGNQKYYLWLIKMDKQLNLISQEVHKVPSVLQELIVDTDRDSNIIVGGSITYRNNFIPYLFGAKLTKEGHLSYLKYKYPDSTQIGIDPYNSFFDYMITMKDSARHVFFDGDKIKCVDSNFTIVHEVNMPYLNNFSYGLNPTVLRLTDTSYYIAGKGYERSSNKMSPYLMTVTLSGRYSNFKMVGLENTEGFIQSAIHKCLDTTRKGDIYIGSTFNYPLACLGYPFCRDSSSFLLNKLDKRLNNVWKKYYGKNGLYIMNGLLATSDGGCLMYGYRYLKTVEQKLEAYIIKVDENGLVTSTTTMPTQSLNINAFPNPSNGQLSFKKDTPSVFSDCEVKIFNLLGQLVFQKATDLSEIFDLSHLLKGEYIYQINQNGLTIAVGKWMKL